MNSLGKMKSKNQQLLSMAVNLLKTLYCCLQATHVAAQYGQTAFIYHIVAKWNADPDVPDNDGRSPLHWFVPCSLHLSLSYVALE